jgi:IS30 family transposase
MARTCTLELDNIGQVTFNLHVLMSSLLSWRSGYPSRRIRDNLSSAHPTVDINIKRAIKMVLILTQYTSEVIYRDKRKKKKPKSIRDMCKLAG